MARRSRPASPSPSRSLWLRGCSETSSTSVPCTVYRTLSVFNHCLSGASRSNNLRDSSYSLLRSSLELMLLLSTADTGTDTGADTLTSNPWSLT